jgi:hypothetical protein
MNPGDRFYQSLIESVSTNLPSIAFFGRIGSRVFGSSDSQADYDILVIIDKKLRIETAALWDSFVSCVEKTRDDSGADVLLIPSMSLEHLCFALRREIDETASPLIVHLLLYPTVDALGRWERPDIIEGFARTLDETANNFIGDPRLIKDLAQKLIHKMKMPDYVWAHMSQLLTARILMSNTTLGETNIGSNSLRTVKYCLRHFTNFSLVRDHRADPNGLKTWDKTMELARANKLPWLSLLERVRGMDKGELSSNIESLRQVYGEVLNLFVKSLTED